MQRHGRGNAATLLRRASVPACSRLPRRARANFRFFLAALSFTALFLAGCANEAKSPGKTDDDARIARSEVEEGPVRVAVEVEPAKARLSDEPVLTLTIDHEAGVTVQPPPFGESLGEFLIRDFREPLPEVQGDRQIVRRKLTLEPKGTGDLSIYPITVHFTDTRPGGDGKEHTVTTEGLTVRVTTAVGSEAPSLADLRPMAPPVEVPAPAKAGLAWILLAAVLLAAGAVAIWLWWRRRRRGRAEQQLSPRELALLELERILDAKLAEQDVKRFYVELTGVVRRYIERTTAVRAPEQTTEEFLREIGTRGTFPPEEGRRLRDFLESADLVKFAAHRPRQEDVRESLRRAKVFLGLEPMEVAA